VAVPPLRSCILHSRLALSLDYRDLTFPSIMIFVHAGAGRHSPSLDREVKAAMCMSELPLLWLRVAARAQQPR
jgi:hypothetical protein